MAAEHSSADAAVVTNIAGDLMITRDAFYELPPRSRDKLLAFHAKAAGPMTGSRGFAGEIVFLDNGEGVYPRLTAAKFPRLRQDLTPEDRARRFLREIQLQTEAFYHPNVHWPFDVLLLLGVPVAYFRRWEGDLSDFIEVETFGDTGRLSLMIQLISGLEHCHSRGLVHQDLKPENVFVRDLRVNFPDLPENDVWLRPLVADFGSVNLAAEKQEYGGSRPYMAPEQWSEGPLGEWTSVFVVGLMLHELMSRGVHPIGEHGGDWHRQVRPAFNRWQRNDKWRRWAREGCPIAQPLSDERLASIVASCLSPLPESRPSLSDVRTFLNDALSSRSDAAAAQVNLFLHIAVRDTEAAEWPHLIDRVNSLNHAIEKHYQNGG